MKTNKLSFIALILSLFLALVFVLVLLFPWIFLGLEKINFEGLPFMIFIPPIFFSGVFLTELPWLSLALFIIFLTANVFLVIASFKTEKTGLKKARLITPIITTGLMVISFFLLLFYPVDGQIAKNIPSQYQIKMINPSGILSKAIFILHLTYETEDYQYDLVGWFPDASKLVFSRSKYGCDRELKKDVLRLNYENYCQEQWFIYNLTSATSIPIAYPKSLTIKETIPFNGITEDGQQLVFADKSLAFNLQTSNWQSASSSSKVLELTSQLTKVQAINSDLSINSDWCLAGEMEKQICVCFGNDAMFIPQILVASTDKAVAIIYKDPYGPSAIFTITK